MACFQCNRRRSCKTTCERGSSEPTSKTSFSSQPRRRDDDAWTQTLPPSTTSYGRGLRHNGIWTAWPQDELWSALQHSVLLRECSQGKNLVNWKAESTLSHLMSSFRLVFQFVLKCLNFCMRNIALWFFSSEVFFHFFVCFSFNDSIFWPCFSHKLGTNHWRNTQRCSLTKLNAACKN